MNPALTLAPLRAPVSPLPRVTSSLCLLFPVAGGDTSAQLGPCSLCLPDLPPATLILSGISRLGNTLPTATPQSPNVTGVMHSPKGCHVPMGHCQSPNVMPTDVGGVSDTQRGSNPWGQEELRSRGVWGQEQPRPTGWGGSLDPHCGSDQWRGQGSSHLWGHPGRERVQTCWGGSNPYRGLRPIWGGQIHTGAPL